MKNTEDKDDAATAQVAEVADDDGYDGADDNDDADDDEDEDDDDNVYCDDDDGDKGVAEKKWKKAMTATVKNMSHVRSFPVIQVELEKLKRCLLFSMKKDYIICRDQVQFQWKDEAKSEQWKLKIDSK